MRLLRLIGNFQKKKSPAQYLGCVIFISGFSGLLLLAGSLWAYLYFPALIKTTKSGSVSIEAYNSQARLARLLITEEPLIFGIIFFSIFVMTLMAFRKYKFAEKNAETSAGTSATPASGPADWSHRQ